jgi:hypothetical protein
MKHVPSVQPQRHVRAFSEDFFNHRQSLISANFFERLDRFVGAVRIWIVG